MNEAAQELIPAQEPRQPAIMPAQQDTTPGGILAIAVQQGADVDKLTKLMELQERWEANEARKAYTVAMNAFKADPPKITKDKHVRFQTTKGVTEYDHATLANVTTAIGAQLAKHGLSHRWDIEHLDQGQIRVTCVITHEAGHSSGVPLQASADQSGGKNNIQAVASTVSYLQRYTLLAATGLATHEMDDDGRAAEAVDYVNDEQSANIYALIDETKANQTKFLKFMGAESVEKIRASEYKRAVHALEQKRKQ